MERSSGKVLKEVLPRVKDRRRKDVDFFFASISGWISQRSTRPFPRIVKKNTDTRIHRASIAKHIHRWLATSIETVARCIRRREDQAMELIENMTASDQAILHDRTYVPIKRSLLELSTQDATLAQNKLLTRQIEALTETLSKLPQQLQAVSSSYSSV